MDMKTVLKKGDILAGYICHGSRPDLYFSRDKAALAAVEELPEFPIKGIV